MLNKIYCVPDEKDSRRHVYAVDFYVCKFWRGERKQEFTANATLTYR